jgi:hypothetical protein
MVKLGQQEYSAWQGIRQRAKEARAYLGSSVCP